MGRLREGRAILMVDGLDEIGTREDRQRLRDDIIFPLLRESDRSHFLLTSRIVGYDEVPFDLTEQEVHRHGVQTRRFYVAPFNDKEIAQFITLWYQLREPSPDKQRVRVESLMLALKQHSRIERLAHNPLLLTLMALIHRVTASLPSGRVELYDKIAEAYLETIQKYRRLGTPARLDEMKRWLAEVGWRMQVRGDQEDTSRSWTGRTDAEFLVSRDEIRQWLIGAISKERNEAVALGLAEDFLSYVQTRSGLLVERGPDEYAFQHLTFQEYFAAFHLRGRVRQFSELAKTCADLATKHRWHETLSLLFELLTEFPGASDDLLGEIASRVADSADTRANAAKLFSALLLDEQSGLTSIAEQKAVDLALASINDGYDETVVQDLQRLPSGRRKRLVQPWFTKGSARIGIRSWANTSLRLELSY